MRITLSFYGSKESNRILEIGYVHGHIKEERIKKYSAVKVGATYRSLYCISL
jgi:hypothetical protein